MKRVWTTVIVCGLLLGCSSYALVDNHFILDPPAHNLRGKTPKDDLAESACDPVKKDDGSVKYPCVVHFMPDYAKLLKEIDRLQTQLKACQQGRSK